MFIYGFECDIAYMLCFFNRLVGSFMSLHICVFHRLYAKDENTHHDSSHFFGNLSINILLSARRAGSDNI